MVRLIWTCCRITLFLNWGDQDLSTEQLSARWGTLPPNLQCSRIFKWGFLNRWTGRGWPILWPPHSSDLSLLRFSLRGHVKTNVYSTKPYCLNDLSARITDVISAITQLQNVFGELQNCVMLCIKKPKRWWICWKLTFLQLNVLNLEQIPLLFNFTQYL